MVTKNVGFYVKFNPVVICEYPDREVHALYIAGQCFGYISIININGRKTLTPFTASGELPEAHCVACAAAELFRRYSGIPGDAIDVVKNDSNDDAVEISPEKALMLLTAIMAAKSSRH